MTNYYIFELSDSLLATKAQVMWTKKEIDPLITLAGLKIVDGRLDLKSARKNTGIKIAHYPLLKEG